MAIWRTATRVGYSGPGSPGYNTWHFRTTGDDAAPTVELAAATAALRDFFDVVRARMPTGCTLTSDGVWSPVGRNLLAVDIDGWSLAGSGGDMNAPALCYNLGWRTSRPGRTGKGRTFLGPTVIGAVGEAGSVVSGVRSDIVGAAEAELISPFSGIGDGSFCVYSTKAGVGSDFVAASVATQFAVLTSRRD